MAVDYSLDQLLTKFFDLTPAHRDQIIAWIRSGKELIDYIDVSGPASLLPVPGVSDAGKVVTVNAGHTGYELDAPVAGEFSTFNVTTESHSVAWSNLQPLLTGIGIAVPVNDGFKDEYICFLVVTSPLMFMTVGDYFRFNAGAYKTLSALNMEWQVCVTGCYVDETPLIAQAGMTGILVNTVGAGITEFTPISPLTAMDWDTQQGTGASDLVLTVVDTDVLVTLGPEAATGMYMATQTFQVFGAI